MASPTEDAGAGPAGAELSAIVKDIASLKRDIVALAGYFRTEAVDGATVVKQSAADQASCGLDNVAFQGDRSARAIRDQIEERPLMSLVLAFGLGFLGGRLAGALKVDPP